MNTDPTGPLDVAGSQGEAKRTYVKRMFDSLAPRYDSLTFLVSLGQTSIWRRRALSGLGLVDGSAVLDVATGTGVAARRTRKVYPGSVVEGMDPSDGMLAEAARLDPAGAYFKGDAESIPRPDNSYDLVTAVYATRNFHDLDTAVREMVRVLKPGGRVLVLDSFLPEGSTAWRVINRLWLERIVPIIVSPFADSRAFVYLAASIRRHVTPAALAAMFSAAGCDTVRVDHYSFGSATRIIGTKKQHHPPGMSGTGLVECPAFAGTRHALPKM
ncbi:MAG: class I SAM-dependent methyltransferase [Myxococcota bacterium]|jgi:demethylmenaquinone methyltransferase/2-methoxy-6-polyprenyl-1,4-benzoquinol methylase